MASVTRSTRRADGHQPVTRRQQQVDGPPTRSSPSLGATAPTVEIRGRPKRSLDKIDHDVKTSNAKKPRITVEIASTSPRKDGKDNKENDLRVARKPANTIATPSSTQTQAETLKRSTQRPPPASTAGATVLQPKITTTNQTNDENTTTKHQSKVANGIKHELSRLQPQLQDKKDPASSKEPGRKLRSQEATRFKSELSAYFPEYDEVIGNEPAEQHLLNIDTPIIVVDSLARQDAAVPRPAKSTLALRQRPAIVYPVRAYGDALFTDFLETQCVDLWFMGTPYKSGDLDDPLPDSLFEPVHKRAERLERSVRNTERGRAQHEKDQIIRLLDGLQGHDWLRVIGVSGVTDTKKKTFEPAREHFIQGCRAILDKFRNWSTEEKRRKLEKERALADQNKDDQIGKGEGAENQDEEEESSNGNGTGVVSRDDTSEGSSPAKQLREEAMARSKIAPKAGNKRPRLGGRPATAVTAASAPQELPDPPRMMTSFFGKKHERDAAMNRHRRSGRKVLAWGHPIPELAEIEFELPEDYRDDETMRLRARRRRREKREHKE